MQAGRISSTSLENFQSIRMGRTGDGLKDYYKGKIEELEIAVRDKAHNLRRLEAQRNDLNTKGWKPAIRGERFIAELVAGVSPDLPRPELSQPYVAY